MASVQPDSKHSYKLILWSRIVICSKSESTRIKLELWSFIASRQSFCTRNYSPMMEKLVLLICILGACSCIEVGRRPAMESLQKLEVLREVMRLMENTTAAWESAIVSSTVGPNKISLFSDAVSSSTSTKYPIDSTRHKFKVPHWTCTSYNILLFHGALDYSFGMGNCDVYLETALRMVSGQAGRPWDDSALMVAYNSIVKGIINLPIKKARNTSV